MLLRHLYQIVLLSLSVVLSPITASAEAIVGQPAPSFSGATAEGGNIELSTLKDKTVVLEWTNHECPYVKKHYESGNIPSLHKEAANQDIIWLQIISSAPGTQGFVDGKTALQLNADRNAKPAKVILDADGKIGRSYEAQTTPHIFIINPQGILVYKGGIDSIATNKKEDIAKAENYVKIALSELAGGKAITKSSTKPYGCSIKYAS
ncbi:hypothetical protein MTYP_02216 [Methylophilaceae bacterium]|nr:hypothetical protein MTYP_02216 [Methylophilaceae bacterium]